MNNSSLSVILGEEILFKIFGFKVENGNDEVKKEIKNINFNNYVELIIIIFKNVLKLIE